MAAAMAAAAVTDVGEAIAATAGAAVAAAEVGADVVEAATTRAAAAAAVTPGADVVAVDMRPEAMAIRCMDTLNLTTVMVVLGMDTSA